MKVHLFLLRFICVSLFPLQLVASPMLVMRLQPDPMFNSRDRIIKKLNKPGKLGPYLTEGAWRSGSGAGIFSSYAGYMTVSPASGLISFPLVQSKPSFHLVVTRKVVPVVAFGNTIDHLAFDKAEQVGFYTIEREKDDVSGALFWRIAKADVPADNKLPLDSIILFAKPKNVEPALGETPTKPGQHFILPDVQVKKGVKIVQRSLYVLSISHFFKPVRLHAKIQSKLLIEQAA